MNGEFDLCKIIKQFKNELTEYKLQYLSLLKNWISNWSSLHTCGVTNGLKAQHVS